MSEITHITATSGVVGRCVECGLEINLFDPCYLAGTGLDADGNSYIRDVDITYNVLFCSVECADEHCGWAPPRDVDESMDGDHASALASAGFGTDEDYGYYPEE